MKAKTKTKPGVVTNRQAARLKFEAVKLDTAPFGAEAWRKESDHAGIAMRCAVAVIAQNSEYLARESGFGETALSLIDQFRGQIKRNKALNRVLGAAEARLLIAASKIVVRDENEKRARALDEAGALVLAGKTP